MDRDRAGGPHGPGPGLGRLERDRALQAARAGADESAWSWVGEDDDGRAREHGEKVDRLAADVELHTRLALIGFTGPEYEEFQTELTRYGLDVMTGWLRTGKIFAKMREAGLGVATPPDGALDRDAQDELAGETVAAALHRFHHDVLLRGQWKPAKGARLTTFFVGQCKLRFANIYRAWLDKELTSGTESDPVAGFDPTDDPPWVDSPSAAIDGPEWKAVARHYITYGTSTVRDPRVHRALSLIACDFTQAEIAAELGESVKTIERMLANHRERIRKQGIA